MKPLKKFSLLWWICWIGYSVVFHPLKTGRIVFRWVISVPGIVWTIGREFCLWIFNRAWRPTEGRYGINSKEQVADAFCKDWRTKYPNPSTKDFAAQAETIKTTSNA